MMNFIIQLITSPAILLGITVLIELVGQSQVFQETIKGVVKTILGSMILTAGAGLVDSQVGPFSEMFTNAFNLTGVVPIDEAVIGALTDNIAEIARNGALILALGFVVNIIIARFSPF